MSNHIIETERHGLWIAVTFTLALLAFVFGLVSVVRIHQLAGVSQVEVLLLHKRLNKLEKAAAAPAAEAAPVAEAAPAE
ncbi:MAG: hypothetical protein K0S46_1125 [Moraxellaceae bacterium]|jgi:hypothetical protein|nr:hypothetical protein [Moraxellaceae bacterium]